MREQRSLEIETKLFAVKKEIGDRMIVRDGPGEFIHFELESDWAGDSETGFGADLGFELTRPEARAPRQWLEALEES